MGAETNDECVAHNTETMAAKQFAGRILLVEIGYSKKKKDHHVKVEVLNENICQVTETGKKNGKSRSKGRLKKQYLV